MSERRRFVFDTNTLVSAVLFEESVPDRAYRLALTLGDVLVSAETLAEATEVFRRPKFDRYVSAAIREEFLDKLIARAVWVEVAEAIEACRDPKDDKFLSLAISAGAEAIVSGDKDLLVMHPFRGIAVVTTGAFLVQNQRAV